MAGSTPPSFAVKGSATVPVSPSERLDSRTNHSGSVLFAISGGEVLAGRHVSAKAAGVWLDREGTNLFLYEKAV
jgi:hypothetical protein